MKICTCCENSKPFSRFRSRTKKGYTWKMGKCMDCEKLEQKKRYHSNLELYRKRGRESSNRYHNENKEKISAKMKLLRKQPNNRVIIHQRKYIIKNREKIRVQHRPVSKKSFIKQRDALTDSYVIRILRQRTTLKKSDILKYPELIETQKLIIKTKRL